MIERYELFLFSNEIVKLSETDKEEIYATYEDMEELPLKTW